MTKPSLTKMELGVFLVWSIRHLGVLLLTCGCLAAALHAQAGAGAIVVSSDEWVFDDSVIDDLCCQDTRFAMNIAGFLVPLGGTILIQSPTGGGGHGLSGTKLKTLLMGMGATVFEDPCDGNTFLLGTVDAIFVSGNQTNCIYSPAALVTYVAGGGHVFLEGGTGCCGGALGEATQWNFFLKSFGLTLATAYNLIPAGALPVSTFHSQLPFGNVLFGPGNGIPCGWGVTCPVNYVYYSNGQYISKVQPTSTCNVQNEGQVFNSGGGGLYAAAKCCPLTGFFQTPFQGMLGQDRHLNIAKSLVGIDRNFTRHDSYVYRNTRVPSPETSIQSIASCDGRS